MGRKPLIRETEYQDVVDRCIADDWSSASISLYLKSRYGHEVEESTIRRYRLQERSRIEEEYADVIVEEKQRTFVEAHVADGHIVDHLGELGNLIRLQRERIEVDLRLESQFGMLRATTRHEIELMGKMLSEYHSMLQDFGVVPTVGEQGGSVGVSPPTSALSFPFMEQLDDDDQDKVIDLTRAIHEKFKQEQLGSG